MGLISDWPQARDQKRSPAFLKYAQEQEEIAQRPIKAQIRANALLQQEINERERLIAAQELTQQPSEYLAQHCTAYTGTLSVEEVGIAISSAVAALHASLQTRGITLHKSGIEKMVKVSNLNLASFDTTSTKNLLTLFEYMDSLGCFSEADVTRPAPVPATEPERPRTQADIIADLESQETFTREGEARARKLVAEALYSEGSEDTALFKEWIASLAANFSFYPTADQQKQAIDAFAAHNLNFRRRENYDIVRRFLSKSGRWPSNLLTKEELFLADVENMDLNTYAGKQEYARRRSQLGNK